MLRVLRPFFEIVVYTSKSKSEAEAIINEIEKDENFFTYIIPFNYCYYAPKEKIYIKDLNIFFGNRSPKDLVIVAS